MDLRAIKYEQSIRAGSSAIAEDYYPYPLSSLSLKTIPTPYPLFPNYSSGSITLKLLLLSTPPPFPVSEDYPYSLPLIMELLLWVYNSEATAALYSSSPPSLFLKTIPTPCPLSWNYSSGSITLKLLLLSKPPPPCF